jgi:nucleotide-binding universal stress UspA family protein
VLVGALHEEIPRYLEAVGAELLVLGVRGIGGEGTGAGSFATSSVRRSTRPVLLVHDSAPERFRAVLACVDFSGSAVAVVHHAAEIAARDGARLDIMHAFDPPWKRLHYRAATPEAAPVFQQQFTAACESRLEALAAPIRSGAQKLAVRTALVEGSSHGRAIVEFAREAGSDLVVLGAHGRSRMLQTFLGTTAERVLRAVPCSMLVVRNA